MFDVNDVYRARSMEEGQLWSLALDVVLERLRGRNSGVDLLTMTGALDRWDYNNWYIIFYFYISIYFVLVIVMLSAYSPIYM